MRRILIANIFISYRREDSADVTGRIHDRLASHFGESALFMDVDDIPLGVDFTKYIDEKVSKCEVLLAIVGRDWLSVTDENGNRRLDMPNDFVRAELESALKRNIPVIPLLVRRASMPDADDLPESIQEFSTRNGMPVRADPDFRTDCDRLIDGLEQDKTGRRPLVSSRTHSVEKPSIWKHKVLMISAIGIAILLVIAGLFFIGYSSGSGKTPAIVGFRASPDRIKQGSTTTLSWKTKYANAVKILPEIGTVEASGSRTLTPTKDTTYTLVATGSGSKSVKRNLSIQVAQSQPVGAFPISRLSIAEDSIELGKSTTLSWQTRHATHVEIQPGIGRVEPRGSIKISPRRDTTYTLTAKSLAGTATSQTQVKVKRRVLTAPILNPNNLILTR
ncbi:MAG: TIR domain-containing protein [Candidatus Thiodiazotropha sp. (ex Lucinoma annulata)]|nr:TIR domain-containing protein [Candidatus Thiodiazotropha sp. (ex Lucinoma annulata)]